MQNSRSEGCDIIGDLEMAAHLIELDVTGEELVPLSELADPIRSGHYSGSSSFVTPQ
jgi:hypothetical protein